VFPNLKVRECVSGKFGTVIVGEIDGTYFKVVCEDLENGKLLINEIETEANKTILRQALVWYGHVDI